MKIDILVPSFHRENSIIRMLKTFEESVKPSGFETKFIFYVQDSKPVDQERLADCANSLTSCEVQFVFVDKEPIPVIGAIRRNAWFKCKNLVSRDCDVLLTSDDDSWFTGDVTPMFELLEEFANSNYLTGFLRSFKNRRPGLVPAFDPKSEVIAGPAMDGGIAFNMGLYGSPAIDWIYDEIFGGMSVGEDIYIMLKTMAMGETPCNIFGTLQSVTWSDLYLKDTTADGGGLHEMLSQQHQNVPKDMVKRNELMSRSTNSYVQYMMADFFHYDSAMSGFRRIRNDLIEYISNHIKPTEQGMVRYGDWGLMKFDGSHRVVFGLDKKDYTTIERKDVEFKNYVDSQSYQNKEI